MFSWRILWLLGLPTGAIIIFLNRFIPESPRFLAAMGRHVEAARLLHRFAGQRQGLEPDDAQHPGPTVIDEAHPVGSLRDLLRGPHARITLALLTCGLGWGLVNFGFMLWLPNQPQAAGHRPGCGQPVAGARGHPRAARRAAGDPALYQRWSSFKALVLFIVPRRWRCSALRHWPFSTCATPRSPPPSRRRCSSVSVACNHAGAPCGRDLPVHLRGSGSGAPWRSTSKFGGILGPCSPGRFRPLPASALLLAIPCWCQPSSCGAAGRDPRHRAFEDIQDAMTRTWWRPPAGGSAPETSAGGQRIYWLSL